MDIEFHYYILHLIAAKAGFRGDDLRVLAYSSQYTDDNDWPYKIKMGRNWFYNNRISQTMDILKPQEDRLHIYPLFHFIPGDPHAESARRADGMERACNTTPNSPLANRIMDESLRTGDLYRIGIACHAYADTWAHQNFVGYRDAFNAFPGVVNAIIPNIGHADARHQPDWPALVWNDTRLNNPQVENKTRFLEAAARLFDKLRGYADPSASDVSRAADRAALVADLDQAIGGRDDTNSQQKARIRRYQGLAVLARFGQTAIPAYDEKAWFDACVDCEIRSEPQAGGKVFRPKRRYTFKGLYKQADWFRFQEAVKAYAEQAESILEQPLTQARQVMA